MFLGMGQSNSCRVTLGPAGDTCAVKSVFLNGPTQENQPGPQALPADWEIHGMNMHVRHPNRLGVREGGARWYARRYAREAIGGEQFGETTRPEALLGRKAVT